MEMELALEVPSSDQSAVILGALTSIYFIII